LTQRLDEFISYECYIDRRGHSGHLLDHYLGVDETSVAAAVGEEGPMTATTDTTSATTNVERYLACMAAHDWDGLAATIADDGLVRDGPFGDVVEGKRAYVDFLRGIITSLKGYELRVGRVTHASERLSFVELSETFEVDGAPATYPECIVFARDAAGLINHVSVFIKQPGGDAPVDRGRAT
jgi:ketosteroid isomerase-like protein